MIRNAFTLYRLWRAWTTERCPVCGRRVPNPELVAHIGWHARATPHAHTAWVASTHL